jgi:serine/threonine protein kinase
VHRDLKPANLFLARRSDGSLRVKLLDFGISKLTPAAGSTADIAMTSTQALMGSPLYMAPEQMRSSKSVDRRADIWSMGVILYEMLGGRSPFNAETLPEVCARIMAEAPPPLREAGASVPPALEAVVMRCLEKEPKHRFPDVAALARALAPFGPPDARTWADRIGRVGGASSPSLPDDRADVSVSPRPTIASARSAAETNAAFGTAAPASTPRRSRAMPLALGGVALAIALAIAFVATRSKHETGATAIGTATATTTATTTTTTTPTPTATTTPTPTPTPTTTTTPTTTPTATPTPTESMSAKPVTSAPLRPIQKPRASPTPGTPKPSGTSGFGGRD